VDVDQVIKLVFFVVVGKWQYGPLKNEANAVKTVAQAKYFYFWVPPTLSGPRMRLSLLFSRPRESDYTLFMLILAAAYLCHSVWM